MRLLRKFVDDIKAIDHFGRRTLILIAGLFFIALGVALSISADLGTSPISSLPYVLSLFTPLTVGNATIIMHSVMIILQIIILKKDYQIFQLIQLPLAVIFGYMTDFTVWLLRDITYSNYLQQWILCIVGILFVGLGVTLEFNANVMVIAGEGLTLAVCKVKPIKNSTMKIILDVSLVALACATSFIFMHGLYGVWLGTVAAAVFVGMTVKVYNRFIPKVLAKVL